MKHLEINDERHEQFKRYCHENGFKMKNLTDRLIEDFLVHGFRGFTYVPSQTSEGDVFIVKKVEINDE